MRNIQPRTTYKGVQRVADSRAYWSQRRREAQIDKAEGRKALQEANKVRDERIAKLKNQKLDLKRKKLEMEDKHYRERQKTKRTASVARYSAASYAAKKEADVEKAKLAKNVSDAVNTKVQSNNDNSSDGSAPNVTGGTVYKFGDGE